MSLQMRVVHFCMGLVPPLLHSEAATEQMALHAPQPAPIPARMRGRFTATCDKGITRVFPKRGLRSGGVLIYLHGGAYVYPMAAGQWGIVEGLIDRTGLPVIIPDYPIAPKHTAAEAFDFVQPIIDEARAGSNRDCIHLVESDACFFKSTIQGRNEGFQVCTRGNFRNDATVAGVLIHGGRGPVN